MGLHRFHKATLHGVTSSDMGDDDWCDDETEPVTSTVPMHWIRFVKTPMHYPSYPDTSGGLPMFQRESDDNIIFCGIRESEGVVKEYALLNMTRVFATERTTPGPTNTPRMYIGLPGMTNDFRRWGYAGYELKNTVSDCRCVAEPFHFIENVYFSDE